MQPGHHGDESKVLETDMEEYSLPVPLRREILSLSEFHTYPAPGVLIGAFMVDYARELLGGTPGKKLFGVCETPKCLPDALQVMARCTTGNNRLRVIPIGKFAITLSVASDDAVTEAVRVFLDQKKLKAFPVIDAWYANSPAYNKGSMKGELQKSIFRAGREILSAERVRVRVRKKKRWVSVTCPSCGETVPDYLIEGDRCGACGSLKYYDTL